MTTLITLHDGNGKPVYFVVENLLFVEPMTKEEGDNFGGCQSVLHSATGRACLRVRETPEEVKAIIEGAEKPKERVTATEIQEVWSPNIAPPAAPKWPGPWSKVFSSLKPDRSHIYDCNGKHIASVYHDFADRILADQKRLEVAERLIEHIRKDFHYSCSACMTHFAEYDAIPKS